MTFLQLLLFGLCVTVHIVFGVDVKLNLDCNNDMENIFCQFEAKNCSEYNLTIQDDFDFKEYSCPLQQCNNKCCCSKELIFTFDNNFTIKVCRENKEVEVKIVNTTESFKAKTPTVVSVKESNGNVEVRWKTNMKEQFNTRITAEVTVYKQGDMMNQVSKNVTPAIYKALQYHVINGKDLDSDTTYMIRVRSFTELNKMYSDSSNELTFKTSPSSKAWALILGLSVSAVLLSAFLFWSFVKLKRKWWDIYSEPKMTISHITNPRVITMFPPTKISVCVTEEEMSKKQFFPEIQVANQDYGCLQDMKNNNSGSSDMFNQTYSLLLPNCSGQRKMNNFERQSQTEGFFGSVCSPNTCDMVNNPDRQAHLFPAQQDGSSLVPTGMSHQWCDAYPKRVSHAEGAGIFRDTTTSGELKTGLKGFEMCCEKAFKHENPFYDCLPDNSHSFLPVKTDFQPVPSKVGQPDALLLQKINAGFEHLLKKYPEETFNKIPQPHFSPFTPGFINNTQNPQCHPGLLLPFLPVTSADETIEVISDYHSV